MVRGTSSASQDGSFGTLVAVYRIDRWRVQFSKLVRFLEGEAVMWDIGMWVALEAIGFILLYTMLTEG